MASDRVVRVTRREVQDVDGGVVEEFDYRIRHGNRWVEIPEEAARHTRTGEVRQPLGGVYVVYYYSLGMAGPNGQGRSGLCAVRDGDPRPYGPEDQVYEVGRYRVEFRDLDHAHATVVQD